MGRFEVVTPAGQFDLELCVTSGQVFRWEKLEDNRWMGVDGTNWYLSEPCYSRDEPARNALAYVAENRPQYGKQELDRLQVESNGTRCDFDRLFRLAWDADEIEKEISRKAPELSPYLGALHGLRLLQPSDATETFFSFLCSPNNNLKRITQMVRHLAIYGPVIDEVAGRSVYRFPRTERIAEISESELRVKGFGYRAATITSIAREVMERGGDDWIRSLKAVPYEETHAKLVELKGIGPKLADCIALFALHHTEATPVDTHLWQAATRIYFHEWRDKPLNDARYYAVGRRLREKLGPLTGWAHQYLFLDNQLNWRERRKGLQVLGS